MDDMVQAFVADLGADGSVPQSTVAAYGTDIRQFAKYVAEQMPDTQTPLCAADMQAFCEWLRGQGYREATIARRVTSLRAFGAFLVKSGRLASNPGDELKPPARVRVEHSPLTAQQVQSLCDRPLEAQTPEGWRDCALLRLLTTTPLRASDLIKLNVTDLKLEHNFVELPDGRHYALPAQTVMSLATYLALGRPRLLHANTNEQALFVNQRGQRLTRQGCWVIVKQHARALDLVDVSLDRLRLSSVAG